MNDTVLVNFHCHSMFSDGEETPEVLAAHLAAAGVRYAALTDHDTLEGLPRFQEALKKRGVACVPGVEMTTRFRGREAHLLGYGFDPQDPDLDATLFSLRQVRDLEVHSIAGSLRRIGANRPTGAEEFPAVSAAPHGWLEIGEAIALIHRAGGRAFWAHPLLYAAEPGWLDDCVAELKSLGIDGIEAIYASFSETERAELRQLAQRHDLLVAAGTDFHASNGVGSHAYAIEMPREDWVLFRAALFASLDFASPASVSEELRTNGQPAQATSAEKAHFVRRRSFDLRIFLPTLIVIALFLAAIWGVILPAFEQTLLDRKRELIQELTNSAWSMLAAYDRDVQSGLLTLEQAQSLAATQIESLRYGVDGRGYFWIQDMQPRMIMHPHRSDLNGQDVSDFTDLRGAPIFVEFAELVRRAGEGYIDYVWQWNDDPLRLEPKESYVKGFAPWGWVIGTGLYIEDVNAEIARLEQNLIRSSLVISSVVVVLLLFVLQQSLRIERERQDVLDSLRESTERYHSLIEATTEGTLLIVDERCRYANPTFLGMTGYTAHQVEFLDLADLLPREADNHQFWERLARASGEQAPADGEGFDGALQHADGHFMECVLALNPIVFAGQRGFILIVRDLARQSVLLADASVLRAAQTVPIGVFRARAARRGALLEMNPAAHLFFTQPQPALADLFSDFAEYEALLQTLLGGGDVDKHLIHIETSDAAARFLALSARLVREEQNQTAYIDGILEDVTTARRQEAGREALIEKYQSSLLFLHEPIASLGRDVLICDMATSIEQVARLMTARNVTSALIASGQHTVIGIVTDHDLRARVLAAAVHPDTPVHTIMSAPLAKISESALIYEALMRMEERGVRHLAVEDRDGQIVNVIETKSLAQFQRYGPIVLTREISRAANAEEVAHLTGRTPPLVKALLDSSARPRHMTHMLASICDAATERLVHLAIETLGAPPAPFAFVAMGSQGRQEQTLVTDQDNGIIFAPAADADLPHVADYYLRLGQIVCDGLDRAGYAHCRGGVMASNPRWCRALSAWVSGFRAWVRKSTPQEIMEFSIFFDFRTVYGDTDLTHALRRTIYATLAAEPAFFHHLAQNALTFKPPFRLLGNIYLSGGATEHVGEINLKDAMMPMVAFARLYALRHQINQTHTLERIEALSDRGLILPSSREEIVASYDFLMQLRLQTQLAAIQGDRTPQNIIHPGKLGYIQQELLKQALAQIAAVQKKISYDFLGGA